MMTWEQLMGQAAGMPPPDPMMQQDPTAAAPTSDYGPVIASLEAELSGLRPGYSFGGNITAQNRDIRQQRTDIEARLDNARGQQAFIQQQSAPPPLQAALTSDPLRNPGASAAPQGNRFQGQIDELARRKAARQAGERPTAEYAREQNFSDANESPNEYATPAYAGRASIMNSQADELRRGKR